MEPELNINTVLGIALGYLLAALVRYMGKSRFWTLVATRARKHLEDPADPINDPQAAAEKALVEAQSDRIKKVVTSIASNNEPPPSIPRVKTLRGVVQTNPHGVPVVDDKQGE
jgi:hypothetical protein